VPQNPSSQPEATYDQYNFTFFKEKKQEEQKDESTSTPTEAF